MPKDTRFQADNQAEYRQPTTQEQAHLTLDELMMQSGGARELTGPHALPEGRTLRLGGPARKRFLKEVWAMQKQTYDGMGNPYQSADQLLAEDVLFDVVLNAAGGPITYAW